MNIIPAHRMEQFTEGIFNQLNDKKLEREASGKAVYNFSIGTPDFPPADHIMEAVALAARNPDNYKYALTDLSELTDAVIDKYKKRYQVTLAKEEVMSVYGSQEGIAHIALPLINKGDIVLVPDPGYPIFSLGPALSGAKLVTYELTKEKEYLPDLDAIAEAYGQTAKMMIVSYPLNPIGKAAPDSFYQELILWAIEHNILIIHDNAYSDIIFDGRIGHSILSFERAKEIAVEFYSLSKSYNYTGARVSFLLGNSKVISLFRRLRSQIDYGTFLPVQYGAIAALTGPDDMIKEQCREYESRRDVLCDEFGKLGFYIEKSQGTMFVWAKIPHGFSGDLEFAMELFQETGILCTPGSSFGELGKGYVRFALVLPVSEIKEALVAAEKSGFFKVKR
ncbi:aminotransferase class I/II-fold pyridoxal phosphate-dependent enzyme [Lachnospiraceae bacterium OttesenSCG-928-D06]|nr:aminotransferase class I/II-fold pyridoxal phosphate-dependent enzyme [Lachnospiraceae bacterium OttesenSCG-928-D06]